MYHRQIHSPRLVLWPMPLLILLLGLWLRTTAAMRMPVQWLEGWSIYLAQNVLDGRIYAEPAEAMRWLSGPIHALLFPVGPEGIWLLRVFSGLLGLIGIAVCIRLGHELDSRFAGLMAALIYCVLPFTVFHERQAIIDPIQGAFTGLTLLFAVLLAKQPRLVWSLLIGLTLAGAFLTKVSALPFLGIPLWSVIWVAKKEDRRRAMLLAVLGVIVALIVIIAGMAPFTRYNSHLYPTLHSVLIDPFIGLSPIDAEADQAEYWKGVLKSLGQAAENIHTYIGAGTIGLFLCSIVGLREPSSRRTLLFLALPAVIFPLAPILSDSSRITYRDTYYAARYMLTSAVPIILIASITFSNLLDKSGYEVSDRMRWATGLAVMASILIPSLIFDTTLIYDPTHTPLPKVDRWQYITGRPSGIGYDKAAETVLRIWQEDGHRPVNLIVTGNAMQLRGYLGPMVGEVIEFRARDKSQVDMLTQWLAEGDIVLFFDGNLSTPLPESPHGALLELVASYPTRWGGMLNVYKVVGAGGKLSEHIEVH